MTDSLPAQGFWLMVVVAGASTLAHVPASHLADGSSFACDGFSISLHCWQCWWWHFCCCLWRYAVGADVAPAAVGTLLHQARIGLPVTRSPSPDGADSRSSTTQPTHHLVAQYILVHFGSSPGPKCLCSDSCA